MVVQCSGAAWWHGTVQGGAALWHSAVVQHGGMVQYKVVQHGDTVLWCSMVAWYTTKVLHGRCMGVFQHGGSG